MADFLSLKDKNDDLVITATDMAVFACVYGKGTVPTKIQADASGALAPLPANWVSLGEIDAKAGVKITPDIKMTPVMGYGSPNPRRMLKTEESVTVGFTAQESKDINTSMFWSIDPKSHTVDPVTGERSFLKKSNLRVVYYSLLLIGADENSAGPVNPYWVFPKVTITKTDAIQLQGDAPIVFPFEFQAFDDKAYGGYVRPGQAGVGNKAINVAGGFSTGS